MDKLHIYIILNVYICPYSQKLHDPTPVGPFFPNSLKLVKSCSLLYTFARPDSALPHTATYEPLRYVPGLNFLPRDKSQFKAGLRLKLHLRRTGNLRPAPPH